MSRTGDGARWPAGDTPVSQNSTACWGRCGRERLCSPSSKGDARGAAIQPGSVDMLGPVRLDTAMPRGLGGRAGLSCDRPWTGAPLGAP